LAKALKVTKLAIKLETIYPTSKFTKYITKKLDGFDLQVLAINKGKHSIKINQDVSYFYYSIAHRSFFPRSLKRHNTKASNVNIKLCMLHIERQYLTNLKVFSID
jgi:hypothetical protein